MDIANPDMSGRESTDWMKSAFRPGPNIDFERIESVFKRIDTDSGVGVRGTTSIFFEGLNFLDMSGRKSTSYFGSLVRNRHRLQNRSRDSIELNRKPRVSRVSDQYRKESQFSAQVSQSGAGPGPVNHPLSTRKPEVKEFLHTLNPEHAWDEE